MFLLYLESKDCFNELTRLLEETGCAWADLTEPDDITSGNLTAIFADAAAIVRGEPLLQLRPSGLPLVAVLDEGMFSRRSELASLGVTHLLLLPLVPEFVRALAHDLGEVTPRQLRAAQRLAAIGRLSGGVAHDFNNLLTAILTYADFLCEDLEGQHELYEDMTEIATAARRAAGLTKQLLLFTRRQYTQPRRVDVTEVVTGLEKLLRRTIGEDVRLVFDLPEGEFTVHADPVLVDQLVFTLVTSARRCAGANGGELRIAVDATASSPGTSFVRLRVSAGWPIDLTSREPGDPGQQEVEGFVHEIGGALDVSDKEFVVLIPAAPPTATTRPSQRGAGTILVVEDEDSVRRLVRRILANHGFEVLEARDGAEGMELIEAHNGTLRLVLTDVVMPHHNGPDVARHVATHRPGVPILFMSGYADDVLNREGVTTQTPLLQKPFTANQLMDMVFTQLESV